MPTLTSRGRGFFRKKTAGRSATGDDDSCETNNVLTKRIVALSKKMAKLKIQLHDVSLAYLQMVQGRLRGKMSRKRQERKPTAERRNLGTLALRMKSTANRVFNRVKAGKVMTFPAAGTGSPIKDPNS